jgi:hypothetical protein
MLKKINPALICVSALVFSFALRAEELPAGTTIEARLLVSTGSRLSHPGDPVRAAVIAPVFLNGRLVLPQGTIVSGTVDKVQRLGFGLKHRTADIQYRFDSLRFSNGEIVPVETRVIEIETAKEHVNSVGLVGGIHPTANLSSALSLYALPFLYATPFLALPAFGIKSLIARTPDPEIYFPAGTEIVLRLTDLAQVQGGTHLRVAADSHFSPEEISGVERLLADTSKRQAVKSDGALSDLVNVVFLGSREEVERAFQAAGWVTARRHSARSLYCMYQGMVERIGDRKAPMSILTLDRALPAMAYEKGLDTFSKRHHLRLWSQPESHERLWLSAATEDVALRVRRMRITHTTDPHIDNERAKVLNDLAFAGCVDAATLLPRPPGRPETNDEGSIITDDKVALIRLNDCSHPRSMPVLPAPEHGRALRGLIAFRNDLVRSNIVFTGYNTVRTFILRPATHANGLLAKADPLRAKRKAESGAAWVRTSLLDVVNTHTLRAQ